MGMKQTDGRTDGSQACNVAYVPTTGWEGQNNVMLSQRHAVRWRYLFFATITNKHGAQ